MATAQLARERIEPRPLPGGCRAFPPRRGQGQRCRPGAAASSVASPRRPGRAHPQLVEGVRPRVALAAGPQRWPVRAHGDPSDGGSRGLRRDHVRAQRDARRHVDGAPGPRSRRAQWGDRTVSPERVGWGDRTGAFGRQIGTVGATAVVTLPSRSRELPTGDPHRIHGGSADSSTPGEPRRWTTRRRGRPARRLARTSRRCEAEAGLGDPGD